MSTAQKVIAFLSGVAVVAFFLAWVDQSGLLSGSTTGIDLATTTESAASGKNLTMLWITPAAALGILMITMPVARRGQMGRWAPSSQIVLAAAAFVVPLLIVPAEIDYWSGEVSFAYGLWLTLAALGCIVVAAIVDQVGLTRSAETPAETHPPVSVG